MNDPLLDIARRLTSDTLAPLKAQFVSRGEVIDLMGVALASSESLFLHGPPGTAKSALIHALAKRVDGRCFDYLLTRFTEPSEIFGPFDIRRLREGDLITNTEGMLPEAELVFLDELLNANSAILNSLLMALNERTFRRGRETRQLPALLFMGASNHLPQDESLHALFDRFLLRVRCEMLPEEHLGAVLEAGWALEAKRGAPPATTGDKAAALQVAEVRQLQQAIPTVDLSGVRPAYITLVGRLRRAGLPISDRRAVKMQRAVAASALLCGRRTASVTDLWVMRHTWDTLEQQDVLAGMVDEVIRQQAPKESDHPRAHAPGGEAEHGPDAQQLGRELEALAQTPAHDATALAVARDRLSALSSRVAWVRADLPRQELTKRVSSVWEQLNAPVAAQVAASVETSA